MPQQLTTEETVIVDRTLRQKGKQIEALNEINALRKASKLPLLNKCTVSRYAAGSTHVRGASENRGQKPKLSPKHVKNLHKARLRLIKRADGERRVTFKDIVDEASLDVNVSQRTIEDALRASGLAYRKPRAKIQISEEDAKKRLSTAQAWIEKPMRFPSSLLSS